MNISRLMTTAFVLLGSTAALARTPIRSVPMRSAALYLSGDVQQSAAKTLALWGMLGPHRNATPERFVLREDTGIRCNRQPCPSDRFTEFKITKTTEILNGSLKYEAVEERTVVPGSAPGAGEGVGNLGRKLVVIDHTGNLNLPVVYVWNVIVVTASGEEARFVGNPTSQRPLPASRAATESQELGLEHLDD